MNANMDAPTILAALDRAHQCVELGLPGTAVLIIQDARGDLAELVEKASNALAEIDGAGFFGPGNMRIEEFRAALGKDPGRVSMSAQADALTVLRGLSERLNQVSMRGEDISGSEAAGLSMACCNTATAVAELIEATAGVIEIAAGREPVALGVIRRAEAAVARVRGAK